MYGCVRVRLELMDLPRGVARVGGPLALAAVVELWRGLAVLAAAGIASGDGVEVVCHRPAAVLHLHEAAAVAGLRLATGKGLKKRKRHAFRDRRTGPRKEEETPSSCYYSTWSKSARTGAREDGGEREEEARAPGPAAA